MKTFLFIIIVLFISVSNAQIELWPTHDAEWYYDVHGDYMTQGFTKYQIDKETIIQGKTCQINKQMLGLLTYNYDDTYNIYNIDGQNKIVCLEDSILYYFRMDTATLDTAVNFKANIGDSWTTDLDGGNSYTITVLNREVENIHGLDLLKFRFKKKGQYGEFEYNFYQLFGSNQGSIYYDETLTAIDAGVDGSLRCFHYHIGQSDELSFNNTNKACDYITNVGINDGDVLKISVVNPVRDGVVSFQGVDLNSLKSVKFNDITGKQVDVSYQINDDIHLGRQELLHGIYFYRIINNDGMVSVGKVLVE